MNMNIRIHMLQGFLIMHGTINIYLKIKLYEMKDFRLVLKLRKYERLNSIVELLYYIILYVLHNTIENLFCYIVAY